ncbi:major capsid protein [Dipodfec virus UA23Rod_1340]|uniref:Major capsid protein n=1 Tax=Dipodfec virus UA23Rod_1340 TaxID=2929330 RepID=A0A976N1Q5_9VIRU|nr:major capsid protein [Dipodfec virus UA23Rod_1340]
MSMFGFVKTRQFKRNKFRLGYQNKMTIRPGYLYPFYLEHCYPNDTFHIRNNILFRLAPMQAPIMQDIDVYTRYFFVPYRLIWSDWKKFWTQGQDGKSDVSYPVYYDVPAEAITTGTLADYLRFPDPMLNGYDDLGEICSDIDQLPFRAYQLIWNEYFRDENIEKFQSIGKDLSGRLDYSSDFTDTRLEEDARSTGVSEMFLLQKVSWRKDRFTSALPFAQRGDEVELPLFGNPKVVGDGSNVDALGDGVRFASPLSGGNFTSSGVVSYDATAPYGKNPLKTTGSEAVGLSNNTRYVGDNILTEVPINAIARGLNVDMSTVSSATINELRRAFAAQEFLEARARGGSRYIEQLLSIFNQRSSDARLQRPEYLGGGKSPIVISDVLQTSQSTESSAQATPAGHGVGVQRTGGIHYHCEEHGFIMGLMYIMPKSSYFQGMPKQYMFRDALEFYNPYFAHLGEQEIGQGEIFYDYTAGSHDNPNTKLFGYTPRYAEMKTRDDEVHGDFRTNLRFWHMGRFFEQPPALNADFLHNFDSVNRVFNVDPEKADIDNFWVQCQNDVTAIRLMPKYGTPRLL